MLAMIGKPFVPGWDQLRPFSPELVLIATIVAVLLAPFFARRSNAVSALVALAGIVIALISILATGGQTDFSAADRGMLLVLADPFAVFWKIILYTFVAGIVLMWFATSRANMHEGDGPEFFALIVGATTGMSLMASTSNLLMLVVAVELASLPSYVLAGFRKTHRVGAEASLKYVLFGAATSSIMIYGLSMLYGLYGTLQIEQLDAQIGQSGGGVPLMIGIAGLIVGLGFKISAVPLHFWCPDVFEGAAVDVSAFLSVASKGAGLMLLTRAMMLLADGLGYDPAAGGHLLWTTAVVIGVLGAVTATVGNTAAYFQTNIKRLLAYSSIAHAGYMLCAVSLLYRRDAGDAVPAGAAAQALLLYLAVYLFMNLGAFAVAGLIHRETGSESIEDYAGMSRRNPLLAACMAVFMFSLVGLPPFAGFVAKLNVLLVLAQGGGWWWTLVAIIGLNTVFSLYYYVRVLRVMYLTDSDAPAVRSRPLGTAMVVACAAMLVGMFIGVYPLYETTRSHGQIHTDVRAAARPAMVAEGSR